jgi:hypothetical protein
MEYIFFMVGVIVGTLLTNIIFLFKRGSGTLQIDHSNPEKDVYRFKIDDLDSLNHKTHITLEIDHDADLSQK